MYVNQCFACKQLHREVIHPVDKFASQILDWSSFGVWKPLLREEVKSQGIFKPPFHVILSILTRTNISFWNNSPLESMYFNYCSDVSGSLNVASPFLSLPPSLSSSMFLRYVPYLLPPLLQLSRSVPHYSSSSLNKRVSLKTEQNAGSTRQWKLQMA
jgi:hypothetical protein